MLTAVGSQPDQRLPKLLPLWSRATPPSRRKARRAGAAVAARSSGNRPWHRPSLPRADEDAQADVAGRALVSPNWLPVILVVAGIIVLAMLAYSILGWTGMR
jgi:hypothetical protein